MKEYPAPGKILGLTLHSGHHNLHVFSSRGFLGILFLATTVVFVPTASSSSISNPLPRALVFDLAGPLWMPPLGHLRGGGGAPFTLNENGNLKEIELYFIETHF